MKNGLFAFLATVTLALLISASSASAQDCASQGGIVVSPSQGVVFSQVSYSFTDAKSAHSSTGQLDINVPQLTKLASSGFINVVTDAGWVTQNVPIVPGFYDNYGYETLSTTFNLNVQNGTPVTSLNATVCYSSQPLTQITGSNLDTFAVGTASNNAEGVGDMNLDEVPAPPPVGGISFDPQGDDRWVLQFGHQNVQTAFMQCGPAAFANNFSWLRSTYGVPVPDPNIKGLRNWLPRSLVGQMDMNMQSYRTLYGRCYGDVIGRWAYNRGLGTGVPVISQVLGSMQYLKQNGIIGLTLKHQGYSTFQCDGFTGAKNYSWVGLVSQGQGTTVDPNFIFNELAAGSAVEYDAAWFNRLGQPLGGHVMDIIGAGTTDGRDWIYYVSDHLQTNQDPTDSFGTLFVDFSYLDPTGGQPKLVQGQMSGAFAIAVITQHP